MGRARRCDQNTIGLAASAPKPQSLVNARESGDRIGEPNATSAHSMVFVD